MTTKVQAWGNSQGLRLSKQVLDEAGIAVGEEVAVSVCDGVIVVAPVRRVRGSRDLRRLVAKIPARYRPAEVSWGPAVGREVW